MNPLYARRILPRSYRSTEGCVAFNKPRIALPPPQALRNPGRSRYPSARAGLTWLCTDSGPTASIHPPLDGNTGESVSISSTWLNKAERRQRQGLRKLVLLLVCRTGTVVSLPSITKVIRSQTSQIVIAGLAMRFQCTRAMDRRTDPSPLCRDFGGLTWQLTWTPSSRQIGICGLCNAFTSHTQSRSTDRRMDPSPECLYFGSSNMGVDLGLKYINCVLPLRLHRFSSAFARLHPPSLQRQRVQRASGSSKSVRPYVCLLFSLSAASVELPLQLESSAPSTSLHSQQEIDRRR